MSKSEVTLGSVIRTVFRDVSRPATLFVWAACCIACVLAGPFGTYEAMGTGARAAYWTTLTTLGIAMGFLIYAICFWLIGKEKTPVFPWMAAGLLTATFGPMAVALRAGFAAQIAPLEVYPLSMTINIFLVSLAVFAFRQFLPEVTVEDDTLPEEPATQMPLVPQPRLMRRLPEGITGPVICLSANDHHVEVVTQTDRYELRMRLSDAIDEMEPVEGICVHRSHWVAYTAVVHIERQNAHKTQVHLSNGDVLPVSRKYKSRLEKEGLMGQVGAPSEPA
ncbi:MAG: LytTR family DNA-binding domain-containing protein [Roseovarius sp.]